MTTYAAVTLTSGATAATCAGVSTAVEAVPAPNQVEVLMVGTPMARASSKAARARFHMIALLCVELGCPATRPLYVDGVLRVWSARADEFRGCSCEIYELSL